jgi:hypothetical protein
MSLIWFDDAVNGGKVAINPEHVVALFVAAEGPAEGKTVIGLLTGTIPVEQTVDEVFAAVNG